MSSYVFRQRLELAAQMDLREWEKKNDGIVKKLITKVTLIKHMKLLISLHSSMI